jgi:hypothetical protein
MQNINNDSPPLNPEHHVNGELLESLEPQAVSMQGLDAYEDTIKNLYLYQKHSLQEVQKILKKRGIYAR